MEHGVTKQPNGGDMICCDSNALASGGFISDAAYRWRLLLEENGCGLLTIFFNKRGNNLRKHVDANFNILLLLYIAIMID